MQEGLMDGRPDEDIGDPQVDCIFLNKTPKYLCVCSIDLRSSPSPRWRKGRKRQAFSGQVCITCSTTVKAAVLQE